MYSLKPKFHSCFISDQISPVKRGQHDSSEGRVDRQTDRQTDYAPTTQPRMSHSMGLGGGPRTSFFIFFTSPWIIRFWVKLILWDVRIRRPAVIDLVRTADGETHRPRKQQAEQ